MLLRHTPKQVAERSGLTINPAKTCQPIGAMYAALGATARANPSGRRLPTSPTPR